MVSSSSYDVSQFNLAAQGHRQPGSTFKTFVLTTAIKQGVDPYSTYYTSKPLDLDLPEWGHWEVHTADEGYLGTINLQQATVASDNTVFAQLDLDVGPENVAETAKSMGIESELDGIPAEGIGGLRIGVSPLEMSDAYATLAAGGIHRNPIAIRRVVFPDGRVDRPEHADPQARRLRSGRLRGDPPAPRQHHRRHRHRGLHRLRGTGGQDRDDRPLHRRLVRRLPAEPLDRGLGRLPAVQRDRNDRASTGSPSSAGPSRRKSGTRSTRTAKSPARNSPNPRRRSPGRPSTASTRPPPAPAPPPSSAKATKEGDTGAEEAGPGRGRRLRPQRLRARRRPGTDADAPEPAPTPSPPSGGGGGGDAGVGGGTETGGVGAG